MVPILIKEMGTHYNELNVYNDLINNTIKIEERQAEVRETLADIRETTVDLGWKPKIKIEEIINEY